MWDEIRDIALFILIGAIINWFSVLIESDFIDKFSIGFISLLTTLLAINIASSTLVAGKLQEIQKESGASFKNTTKLLKRGMSIQIGLIIIALFVLILKDSNLVINIKSNNIQFCLNTILITIFLYYLDTIRDIGIALFQLLDFDTNSDK